MGRKGHFDDWSRSEMTGVWQPYERVQLKIIFSDLKKFCVPEWNFIRVTLQGVERWVFFVQRPKSNIRTIKHTVHANTLKWAYFEPPVRATSTSRDHKRNIVGFPIKFTQISARAPLWSSFSRSQIVVKLWKMGGLPHISAAKISKIYFGKFLE